VSGEIESTKVENSEKKEKWRIRVKNDVLPNLYTEKKTVDFFCIQWENSSYQIS
jgi:hypothetical protein